jgi:hypothetical protein
VTELPESTPEPSDLEYDLAQEATASQPGLRRRGRPEQGIELPDGDVPDDAGDYGYDMAHDVPRAAR